MKTITVTISKGKATIDLDGFHGEGCGTVMDDFTRGARVISEINKAEFLEEETETEKERAIL